MKQTTGKEKKEEKVSVISVNCFRCGFKMEQTEKSDLYEQLSRMIGCPNGCQRPSLQKIFKKL